MMYEMNSDPSTQAKALQLATAVSSDLVGVTPKVCGKFSIFNAWHIMQENIMHFLRHEVVISCCEGEKKTTFFVFVTYIGIAELRKQSILP